MRLSIWAALAATLLLPIGISAARAQQPNTGPARLPVMDPYYTARQQAKGLPPATAGEAVVPAAASINDSAVRPATPLNVVYDQYYANRRQEQQRLAPPPGQTRPAAYQQAAHATADYSAHESVGPSYDSAPNDSGDFGYSEGCGTGCDSPQANSVLWNEIQSCRVWWANVEYLSYWAKGNGVPPLVTTSPPGTPQSDAGVLGEPGTSVLFGNDRINDDQRNGGRITVGGWWVGDVVGVEGNYYALGTAQTNYFISSNFSAGPGSTDPIVARPFFNENLGLQDSLVIAFPNFIAGGLPTNLSGTVDVNSKSDVQSAGLGLKHLLTIDIISDHRTFLVGGFRFFRLDEDLTIYSTILPVGGIYAAGTRFTQLDQFATTNIFYGGDVGLTSDLRRGLWSWQNTFKIALGNMQGNSDVGGRSTSFAPGFGETVSPDGLYAQSSIIGHHRFNRFAVIPEFETKLGLQLTPGLRATVGYNFTYVSRVLRPGNELDLSVNPVTHTRTAPLGRWTDFWLQGITAGVEYRF